MVYDEQDDGDEKRGSNGPEPKSRENDATDQGSAADGLEGEPDENIGDVSSTRSSDNGSRSSEDGNERNPNGDTEEPVVDESTGPRESQRESEPDHSSATADQDTGAADVDVESELSSLKTALEESKERVDELETRLDDYERRNDQEHEDLRKYAVEDLAREMLNVKDMLGDAIRLEDLEADTERRLGMVEQQFENVLTSGRIELIEPNERDPYDDRSHRMEGKVQADGYEPNQVVRVLDVGYRASDRVIRPARVEVAAQQED